MPTVPNSLLRAVSSPEVICDEELGLIEPQLCWYYLRENLSYTMKSE